MTFGEFLRYLFLLVFFPRSLKTMEWRMLKYLNKNRTNNGLKPIRMQEDLREVARKHSKDMAQKDYFDHINTKAQSPADRLKLSGVSEVVSGENLAKIGGYHNPTQVAEDGLMESPGHRANILNPAYNTVGIGVIQSTTKMYYFTQNFAKRNLIFKKKIKKKVTLRAGLHLEGETFSEIKNILCQIHAPKEKAVLEQTLYPVQNNHFNLKVTFPKSDWYEVWLFADLEGKGQFILTNFFEVKVKKGFLG